MFRELVERNITNRGLIVATGDIHPTVSNYARYASLFMFGADIQAYVKTNGNSVKDYKGKTYTEAIWFDIDYEQDVNEARLSAITLIKKLNSDYQVNPEHLFIYFSGFKGFHIALFNKFLNFSHTDAVSPDKVKDFVKRITTGIDHVDAGIYEPVRIFRIDNSKHEKGLYKIRISFEELNQELEQIKKLATNGRKYPYETRIDQIQPNQQLVQLWNNSGVYVQEQAEYKGNLFQPPPQGARNKTLLVQACTLFRKSELSSYAIFDIVSNAATLSSQNSIDKITNEEVKKIVQNAERLVGSERKKEEIDTIQMKSFGEWMPEWENYILQERTNMSLCFMELNRIMKGRLKGHLFVVMGYGGSKKSLYALNVILRNKDISEDVFLYSTMEMSVPQLMNRIIDHEVKSTDNRNAHEVVEEQMKTDLQAGRNFMINELSKVLGNKLQIIANGRMTYQHYKAAIQKVRETIGAPGVLIVDGLSMMGGKGTETELYSQNSADLKQLANEENIFIILICHVSKGEHKHTRDLSRVIRGSEKILDNCDFYMSMSQIQDELNTEMYNKNKGFINFHDKRGTGMVVDVVFEFDPKRLKLLESMDDPKHHYEKKRTKIFENDF